MQDMPCKHFDKIRKLLDGFVIKTQSLCQGHFSCILDRYVTYAC